MKRKWGISVYVIASGWRWMMQNGKVDMLLGITVPSYSSQKAALRAARRVAKELNLEVEG